MINSWIIQSTNLRRSDDDIRRLLEGLDNVGISWADFGIIPGHNEITGADKFPNGKMFLSGSTKALRILTNPALSAESIFPEVDAQVANDLKLDINIYYDQDRFDQSIYMMNENLQEHLLNGDAEIVTFADACKWWDRRRAFIKPSRDLKAFGGIVLEPFKTLREELEKTGWNVNVPRDEPVIISRIKEIAYEWRLFVVHGIVVASSQYKRDNKVEHHERVPAYVIREAERFLIPLYKPDPIAFVMDVCLLSNAELKIVEYNCINCSGFYRADIAALADAVKHAF